MPYHGKDCSQRPESTSHARTTTSQMCIVEGRWLISFPDFMCEAIIRYERRGDGT